MKKKLLSLFIVFVFVLTSFSSFTTSSGIAKASDPDPTVTVEQAVLDEMQANGSASYWIQFKNTVDLSPAYTMSWSDRGWFVYKTLLNQAEVTQAQVQKYLLGSKVDYKSYWINNSILVTSSSKSVLNDLLKFDGIESIQARKSYILYEPDTSAALLDNGINAVEPNLTHVNADDVWALGIDGAGLVIANIDTGVRYSHQALVGQYRGNLGGSFDHNYNWFNPDDLGDNVPRDGHGHGTHTMGTMVGDDGSANQIGIAPGAEWMACAGCPDGGCTDSALLGCGQFIAAPTDLTGNNPNPDLRPNAVNNSWGDCGQTYDPWFAAVIDGWHAVGTYPIFSNGNASNCGYPAPPGLNTVGNPARSGNVTGVGSSGEQNGQYATHSNWGPTDDLDTINPVDPFAMLKPQVLAPGVSIRSSVPTSDTSYEDGWTGTSMSAPHVTGLVALIMQAAPCLVGEYAAIETIIESTAVDMVYDDGSALTPSNFPNFATGWGEIDALAAVNYASGECAMGTLEGMVTTDGFSPVEGAKIFADNGAGYTKNIYTDSMGYYSTGLPDGTYTLTASKYGYQSDTVTGIVITEGATTMQDFIIPELGMSLVSGYVYDGGVEGLGAHGYPLYSSIHVSTPGFDETIFTDPFTGYYEIELVASTEHTFTTDPIPGGYEPLVEAVTATGTDFTHDIYVPVDGAVCAAPGYQPDYDIFYSFEGSDEGFTPGGTTSFAWGDFTSGPGEGHSGTKGIATNPGGVYNPSELGWMASPAIDLTGFGTASPVIQWWDWKDIESVSYDWARLDVTKDGGTTWITVWGPVGGVTDTEYHQQTVVLDPTYNVANFQFRFYFKSDSSVQYDGWYVDDVGIVSLPVPPATTVFSSNFDADNGGFVASGTNSTWAWGVPTSGPGAAYSAPNAWATNLAGYYNNSEESYITSPVIDLSAHAGLAPTISFMHWYNSESNTWDWGSVEASMDGGATWNVIWQKFGTSVDPWTPKSLQLDPAYAVSNFRFRFHFHSDSSVNSYYGWYIDDVAVTVAEPVEVAAPCVVIPGGVVAGYVYDDNDDSPIVGADVYSDVVETQTFFIPEDPASEGLFWVFHPVMGPVKGVQSLYGSNVVFDPTAGGASGYEPGVPTTLCFESNIYTGDWEYLYDTWLKFPMDWTISSAYLVGTPTCDSGSWGSFSVYWETEPYEIDIYHSASTEEVDHCVAEYCVDVTPSASAGLVSWYFDGDGYGSGPHHPCSSDSYTPGSMASQPCDQWENPQASIPAIGGEAHDFIAEKALYGSDTQTVTVFEDFIVQQDFYLGTGELEFDPESLEVTMFMGDAPVTETLTISNGGTSDAMFELVEKDEGFVLPKMMIPAFKGELPEDTRPVSMGLAPDAGKASTLSASKDNPFKGILAGESAFAVDAYPGENLVYFPDTTLPGTWTIVGGVPGSEFFAGDFVGGDFSQLYVVNSTGNTMYSVNTATTAQTMIGVTTPPSGQSFSGLTGTPDGTMYGLTTSCGGTNLVMVDVATAATTDLGALPGIDCGIDLAYNTDDDMIYIVDLITDSLFRVDPTTVTVTLVGSLGAAPNYAQGMDYEEESGVLYWAAYTTAGELRIIDTTTGASTLVGAFPGGAEVDSLAFATGGQSDVPWLSEDPISGTVPAEGSIDIDVIYDPTGAGLTQPGNYLAELKVKHDTPYTYPNIPVVLHLIAPEDYGTFNGHVLGMEACDVNPAALEGATVNFWQDGMIKYTTTTNAEGYYSYAVPEGMYDIEVMMDGYMSDIEFGRDVLGGDTVTVDFTLRLEAPCISVDPTSLEQTQPTDTVTTQTLTIINTGAGDGVFELFEMEATGLHADVELIVDDGTRENGIGIGGTLEFLWLNRFTPDPDSFPFNLDQVQIYFTAEDMVNIGDEIRIVVYENVTANADPAVGSNFLYSYDTTVQALGTWNLFDLPEPVELNGPGDVLVGLIGLEVPGTSYWPAAIDETATQGRSWAGWWNASPPPIPPTLPPDADWTLIDAYFPGNWMVRGMGSSAAGDILWLSLDPTAGVVFADSETDVTVTYDSTGLAEGDYFASIRVKNPPAAAINVPVTLHVTNLRMLYLPLILK